MTVISCPTRLCRILEYFQKGRRDEFFRHAYEMRSIHLHAQTHTHTNTHDAHRLPFRQV